MTALMISCLSAALAIAGSFSAGAVSRFSAERPDKAWLADELRNELVVCLSASTLLGIGQALDVLLSFFFGNMPDDFAPSTSELSPDGLCRSVC